MFPLKPAFISPHFEDNYPALRSEYFLTRPPRMKDFISIILAIVGIIIISGVCYLTLLLAHPIFAYEGNYESFSTKAQFLTPKELEAKE